MPPKKVDENEDAIANATASPSLTIKAIFVLLQKHYQELSAGFKLSLAGIEAKLDQTKLLADDHDQQISSLELAADDLSQWVLDLKVVCSTLREENTKLKTEVTDLSPLKAVVQQSFSLSYSRM